MDGHLEGEKPYPECASGMLAKMDAEEALQNARQEKAEALRDQALVVSLQPQQCFFSWLSLFLLLA